MSQKKLVIEQLDLLSCVLLQKNKALGIERKAVLDVGFIRSQVVVGAFGLRGEEDAWLVVNATLCSSILFAAPTNP